MKRRTAAALLGLMGASTALAASLTVVPAVDPELLPKPRQTVVLLTSFDLADIPAPLHFLYFRNYERDLESAFRAHFRGRGYRVQVKHHADQYDLWAAATHPHTAGLFWVSHAGAGSAPGNPLFGSPGTAADWRGFDVLPVLGALHPNVRYLGLIGCESFDALKNFMRLDGMRARNPRLTFAGFNATVDAKKGLVKLLRKSDRVLTSPEVTHGYVPSCPVRRGYRVRVTRFSESRDHARRRPRLLPAVRIESAGRVLAMLPAAWNGAIQVTELFLDDTASPTTLKLVASTGTRISANESTIELGRLEPDAPWSDARWQIFAKRSGEPIGTTSNVYRYMGELPTASDALEYYPHDCRAMPPLRPPRR